MEDNDAKLSGYEIAILEIIREAQQMSHAEGYNVGYDRGWKACSAAMEPRL